MIFNETKASWFWYDIFPDMGLVGELDPDVETDHLCPVFQHAVHLRPVRTRPQHGHDDVGDLWKDDGERLGAAVLPGVQRQGAVLSVREVGGAESVGSNLQQMLSIILT